MPKFKLIQDLIVVLIVCKNEEDPIINEGARVVTTFFINFSDAQGQLTPKTAMESCLNSNPSRLLWLVLLSARMKKIHPKMKVLNSVQKLCGTGFSQFLLLFVILGPTSLWESYSCRPPLISPASSMPVEASGKALISWENSRNWEIRLQTKTIWHVWNALHERILKCQYFHYNIWEWLFQLARNSWEIIKRDYTPYIWKNNNTDLALYAPTLVKNNISSYYSLRLTFL